jgi:putative addiction module component (TIGR02574 family)
MSKMEILAELPKLELADRREIFDRICEMEESDLLTGGATDEERALLDRELEKYRRNPEAGSSWNEVEARIRKSPACLSS